MAWGRREIQQWHIKVGLEMHLGVIVVLSAAISSGASAIKRPWAQVTPATVWEIGPAAPSGRETAASWRLFQDPDVPHLQPYGGLIMLTAMRMAMCLAYNLHHHWSGFLQSRSSIFFTVRKATDQTRLYQTWVHGRTSKVRILAEQKGSRSSSPMVQGMTSLHRHVMLSSLW